MSQQQTESPAGRSHETVIIEVLRDLETTLSPSKRTNLSHTPCTQQEFYLDQLTLGLKEALEMDVVVPDNQGPEFWEPIDLEPAGIA